MTDRAQQAAEAVAALSGSTPAAARRALDEFTVRDQAAALAAGGGGGQATLAQVLGNGNDVAGNEIVAATNPGANAGAFLQLEAGTPATNGGDATLQAGDGAAGERGGDLFLLGGAGDNQPATFAQIRLRGNNLDGGEITIEAGDATGLDQAGGSITLTPGAGNGTGADGGIIFDTNLLPTSDPGNPGQVWVDGVILKVSAG